MKKQEDNQREVTQSEFDETVKSEVDTALKVENCEAKIDNGASLNTPNEAISTQEEKQTSDAGNGEALPPSSAEQSTELQSDEAQGNAVSAQEPQPKLPIGERVTNYFAAIPAKCVNAKDRFVGFFVKIGNKCKAVGERYKTDGPKQFAKECGVATWKGTKKLSKRWFIDAFTGMAQGLFVTLIAGLIIKQIGGWIGDNTFGRLLTTTGNIASFLMGAGIGAGIASYLKAPKLVIFTAMVAGMIGAFSTQFISGDLAGIVMVKGSPGNPISAYICALMATEIGMKFAGKTKLDILLVPLGMMLVTLGAVYVCIPFVWLIDVISNFIQWATGEQPVVMGIVISVVVGILLTMPTSSAAICISLKLGGIAGGAAVVGCACQMIGFAVQSYRENKFSGLISQGIGTSMLQIPNIMKKPIIFLPPIVASAIAGPLATAVFRLECAAAGSGMGTSGFVGIFATIEASVAAGLPQWKIGLGIALLFFIIPIIVCVVMSEIMRKFKLINYGDMALNYNN